MRMTCLLSDRSGFRSEIGRLKAAGVQDVWGFRVQLHVFPATTEPFQYPATMNMNRLFADEFSAETSNPSQFFSNATMMLTQTGDNRVGIAAKQSMSLLFTPVFTSLLFLVIADAVLDPYCEMHPSATP